MLLFIFAEYAILRIALTCLSSEANNSVNKDEMLKHDCGMIITNNPNKFDLLAPSVPFCQQNDIPIINICHYANITHQFYWLDLKPQAQPDLQECHEKFTKSSVD